MSMQRVQFLMTIREADLRCDDHMQLRQVVMLLGTYNPHEPYRYAWNILALIGKIRWYMVAAKQLPQLKQAIVKLIKQQLVQMDKSYEFVNKEGDDVMDELLLVLFVAKQVFPPPEFLISENIQVYEFDMIAGECLYCDGDWVHFGFNQAPHSLSLAINVLPESWLQVLK